MDKVTTYSIVTNKIVEALEKGTKPWVKPWGAYEGYKNLISGHKYRGINVLTCLINDLERNFQIPYFMTYKQAQSIGGNVKKGEKATPIVYFQPLEKENASGEKENFFFAKYSSVFNISQIENIDSVLEKVKSSIVLNPNYNRHEAADLVVKALGVKVETANSAYHMKSKNAVFLPEISSFKNEESYYSTLFHEIAHWTGTKERLNRKCFEEYSVDKKARALEELVAELTASFCCARLGFNYCESHADYIGHWIQLLKSDDKAIFKAASLAQKASDYIFGEVTNVQH